VGWSQTEPGDKRSLFVLSLGKKLRWELLPLNDRNFACVFATSGALVQEKD
jgi:hypothetical protein